MIVQMTINGRPAELEIRITSSEIPDPFERATRAAHIAYTQVVAGLVRAWQAARCEGDLPELAALAVNITAIYCCDRCRKQDPARTMRFRRPGVALSQMVGAGQ